MVGWRDVGGVLLWPSVSREALSGSSGFLRRFPWMLLKTSFSAWCQQITGSQFSSHRDWVNICWQAKTFIYFCIFAWKKGEKRKKYVLSNICNILLICCLQCSNILILENYQRHALRKYIAVLLFPWETECAGFEQHTPSIRHLMNQWASIAKKENITLLRLQTSPFYRQSSKTNSESVKKDCLDFIVNYIRIVHDSSHIFCGNCTV